MGTEFDPFCPKCGHQRMTLPYRGFGASEFGCENAQCTAYHPYFLSQRIERLEFALNNLAIEVKQMREDKSDG